MAEALLVTAGHQRGACGAAVGTRNVAARETNAAPGQRVNVRRRNLRIALATELAVAQIVPNDDENIGFALGTLGSERHRKTGENDKTDDQPTTKKADLFWN